MHIIHLRSEPRGDKPETIVEGESLGTRERQSWERVHLREGDSTICTKCGQHALIWYDSEERWEVHPFNCKG
jgi:hypothetical protein